MQLLEDAPGDVGPLLEHRAFDARHDRLGLAARGELALLDEQPRAWTRIDQMVDAPKPTMRTATMTSVIFAVSRDRSIARS